MKLIAETAWHHDGNFRFFKNLVNTIAQETKTDYIKFHITLDVDEYMHIDHPAFSWVKDRVFSKVQWDEIFNIALDNSKKLMLLFNDQKAIDFGMIYQPEIIEIHSVCLNDIKLLNHLKTKIKPETKIVLGVGGSDLYEIENAIQIIDTDNIVLMHGFQNYPTKYEDINFGKIKKILSLYPDYQHGYADHTAWDNENNLLVTLLGAALGMDYIEKHVTIEYGKERVDWQAAISIEMFKELLEKLNIIEQTNGDGLLKLNAGEKLYSVFGPMKKAAIINSNVKKGDVLDEKIIDFKRTKQISDLSQLDILNLFGRTFSKALKKGHSVLFKDIKI